MARSLSKWTLWWCTAVVRPSEKLWKTWASALSAHSIMTEDLAMNREREREWTLLKVLKEPRHPLRGPARWLRPCGDWKSELASHLLGLLNGLVLKGPVRAPEVVDSCGKIRAENAHGGAKQLRVQVSQDMLDSTSSDPDFMNTIITGDESLVNGYDPETKSKPSQCKNSTSPRPNKVRQVCSNVSDAECFPWLPQWVHHKYTLQNQTIIKEY